VKPVKVEVRILPDGQPVIEWVCRECRRPWLVELYAEECCKPPTCECGKPAEYPYSGCKECREETRRKREQAIWDKAKKVRWVDYDGVMLICDRDDEFYSDPAEIFDAHYADPPTWAWGTYAKKLKIDAIQVIDDAIENEGFLGDETLPIPDLTELQKALDAVCEQIPETYWEDQTVVVTFEEEAEEYRKESEDESTDNTK